MKFTDIKDFDLTDILFVGGDYLDSNIIEVFDYLGVLDLMRNIYIDKALASELPPPNAFGVWGGGFH